MIDLINNNDDGSYYEADWFEKEYSKSFIDLNEEPEKPKPIISIGEYTQNGKAYSNPVFTAGEFSCISAPSKSYKSFFKSHLAGAFLKGSIDSFDNLKGSRSEDEVCIDIDTEQGKYYSWRTFKRVLNISEANLSEHYYPFKLRHLTPSERVKFIDELLRSRKIKGTPKVVFIDGIADLIEDSNDLVMSHEIAGKVMKWTDEFNLHICVIIHNAYGTLKPTGHLGSSVVKKAEAVINLEPQKIEEEFSGVVKVKHQYSRGRSFDDFFFTFDEDTQLLRQCDEFGDDMKSNINDFTEDKKTGNPFDVIPESSKINDLDDIPF